LSWTSDERARAYRWLEQDPANRHWLSEQVRTGLAARGRPRFSTEPLDRRPRLRTGERFRICGHSVAEHGEWHKDARCRDDGYWRCKTCRRDAQNGAYDATKAKRRADPDASDGLLRGLPVLRHRL
jgi:hypothetical protein